MSPAGEVAQNDKTRLTAIVSFVKPVLMSWAWSFLRSFMVEHFVSSMER